MAKISWGKLPRYFFKEYASGISINAASMPYGIISEKFDICSPDILNNMQPCSFFSSKSETYLRGFDFMKNLIITSPYESNPMLYLSKLLFSSVYLHNIHDFALIALKQDLIKETPFLLKPFELLQAKQIYFGAQNIDSDFIKNKNLIILLECKSSEKEENSPSLYTLRKNLLQNGMPNITITLQNSSSFSLGALAALMQATALNLNFWLNEHDKEAVSY